MRNSENKVTVQVLGSTARVVGLDEVATVGEAKELMGVPNYTATVNGEPAEDDEDVKYRAAQVKEAIKELPEGYRLVLSLYLLEGYDHEEIGQILNIAENTSRTQFLRAKRKLVELLKRKEVVG